MITFKQYLTEESVTLPAASLRDLIDPKTGKYYTGEVNITGDVHLYDEELSKLPVKFGTVLEDFYCYNNKLTSLQGAPSSVGGFFSCNNNKLTSLEGAPSSIGRTGISCDNNKLTSLEGIHKVFKRINGRFHCDDNPITSGGIGLILIEGLTKIRADHPAFLIIEKYLGQGKKGLLLCQDELIDAGYEEFAKL
jgi:hypothetical protein